MFDDKNYQNEYNQGKTDKQMQDSMTIIMVMMICFFTLLGFAILFFSINYIAIHCFGFDFMKFINT
jgi:hypothetical protein